MSSTGDGAKRPLVIRMQSPGWGSETKCVACKRPSSGFHSLPTFNGDIVSNDWAGEWFGKPCCERCYERHAAGQMRVNDHLYEHLLGGHIHGSGI